jgi:phthiodiolone/phenolphthiodiolone dimycocerosates ketoreductase
MPTTVTREEALRVVSHIPGGIVREHTLAGTPEMIAEQIRAYQQAGLRDVVLWNITPFADPELSAYSFEAMKRIKALVDGAG